MKTSCEMTKDLLPLVLDEIASNDSRSYAADHLAGCTECQKYYELLQKNTMTAGRNDVEQEERQFEKAAAALQRKRAMRSARKFLSGALIAIMFLFSFYGVKQELYDNLSAVQMNANDYNVRLSLLADGSVMASVKLLGRHDIGGTGTTIVEETGGMRTLQFDLWTSVLPHRATKSTRYQQLLTLDISDCDAVCIGKGSKIIWQRGEDIPPASQEMETYLKTARELQLIYAEEDYANRVGYLMGTNGTTEAEQAASQERAKRASVLENTLERLLPDVPEWQAE